MKNHRRQTRRALAGLLSTALVLSAASVGAGAAGSHPFRDVAGSSWYADSVQYVYDNSLMTGVSARYFQPSTSTNRAMLVTILHRIAGEPEPASSSGFYDVLSGSWYGDPVAWASENAIVTGYDGNVFRPDKAVTRQEMVTILFRYAQYQNQSTSLTSGVLTAYSDYEEIQTYARRAMNWAVGKNIITGKSDTVLDPNGTATRAEIATIIMRYCKLFGLTDNGGSTGEPTEDNTGTAGNTGTTVDPSKDNTGTTGGTSSADTGSTGNTGSTGTGSTDTGSSGNTGSTGTGSTDTGSSGNTGSTDTGSGSSQGSAAAVSTEKNTVIMDGYSFYVGMTTNDLPPINFRLSSRNLCGGRWRIYMPNGFDDFCMIHITDEGVVDKICAIGRNTSFMNLHPGDQPTSEAQAVANQYSNKVKLVLDTQGDGSVAMVIIGETTYYDDSMDTDLLWEECYLNYYCVNAFRVQKGLAALNWSEDAATVARQHCQDMADNNYFDHTSLDGTSFGDRMRNGGISFSGAAENIACYQDTGLEVLISWIHSSGHRANILSANSSNVDYDSLGVGAAYGGHYYDGYSVSLHIYWTQDFYKQW